MVDNTIALEHLMTILNVRRQEELTQNTVILYLIEKVSAMQ